MLFSCDGTLSLNAVTAIKAIERFVLKHHKVDHPTTVNDARNNLGPVKRSVMKIGPHFFLSYGKTVFSVFIWTCKPD
jgi:hypothetical protein